MQAANVVEVMKLFRAFYLEDILPFFRQAFLRPQRIAALKARESDGLELAGELDLNIEAAYVRFLERNFPHDAIVGEEGTRRSPDGAVRTWFIDPLDGTHNFLAGITSFGSQCALVQGRQTLASFIFLPVRELLGQDGCFAAVHGQGAWQFVAASEKRPLAVSAAERLSEAFMLFEGPGKLLVQSPLTARVLRTIRRFRTSPSCSVSGVLVASGGSVPLEAGIAGLVACGTQRWDNLPISLLVREAGGRETVIEETAEDGRTFQTLILSNPAIHDQILALSA